MFTSICQNHHQQKEATCLCEQASWQASKGEGGGGEGNKRREWASSFLPTPLLSMRCIYWQEAIFVHASLCWLFYYFWGKYQGPLVVFISLYHYTNFRFIVNPKSGNFLPDGVWAFVMKLKSMMKQTQSYCTWWVENYELFFLFWSLNLFSSWTCQMMLHSHPWKLQCLCKSWDFKIFIVIM